MDAGDQDLVDERQRHRGRHPALDRGAGDLAVALRGMAVADGQHRVRHGDRQEQRRPGDELAAVDVAAAEGPRRDRGVLPGRFRREPHDAEERRRADAEPQLVPGGARGGVDVPEQGTAGRRVREPERPVQFRVDPAGPGVAPVVRHERVEPHGQDLSGAGARHRDRADQAVPAASVEQGRCVGAGRRESLRPAGGAQRPDGHGVAVRDPEHGGALGGQDVDGGVERGIEAVGGHRTILPAAPPQWTQRTQWNCGIVSQIP